MLNMTTPKSDFTTIPLYYYFFLERIDMEGLEKEKECNFIESNW
jgi:hypothetical protein